MEGFVGAGQLLLPLYTIERLRFTLATQRIRHERQNNFFSNPNPELHVENACYQKLETKK